MTIRNWKGTSSLLLSLLSIWFTQLAFAQSPIKGWNAINVFPNEVNPHSGKKSACLRMSGSGNDPLVLQQSIKADHYRGKKVQFSAWVMIQDWIPGFLVIGMEVSRKGGATNGCFLHPIESTKGQWVKQPWSPNKENYGQCDVPNDAVGMTIHLELHAGPNRNPPQVCIDDVAVDVIGDAAAPDPATSSTVISDYLKQRLDSYASSPLEFVNLGFEQ